MEKDEKKIAHLIRNDENGDIEKVQTIEEHLENVALLSKKFAGTFGYGDYAYVIGKGHDIGKYSEKFQEKIKNNLSIAVDHSTAGAKELIGMRMLEGALAIAGHHGGLPNGRSSKSECLVERVLKKKLEYYGDYKKEIILLKKTLPNMERFSNAFLTRMLFSCLVDADFLDTERFMQEGKVERQGYDSIKKLKNKLDNHIEKWLKPSDNITKINKTRTDILKQCIDAGKSTKGIYSLTVPTGAGKTISSLAFALHHAVQNKMDRIIYVIPYTSIIEQNAKVFREILGDKNVVEHHANAYLDNNDNEYLKLHQLSIENWDAPIIVTTNVQFFESLYSNKVSVCRKLHNIANSVIIFDEAQMIPLNYLKPCIRAVRELVEHYNVTAVMCTATQPALDKWFNPLKMNEICKEHKKITQIFKRTTIKNIGVIAQEELAERIKQEKQVLIIVNLKKEAQELYRLIKGEGSYHLSTFMTPCDRTKILNEIKEKLENGEACRVVSTSLVEAGVDVDFPCVYRAEAGLDSIVQAAGRCNRNGKNSVEESVVWVFSLDGKYKILEKNISMMRESVEKYGKFDSEEVMQYYFTQLQNLDETYLDQKQIIESFESEKGRDGVILPFADVSKVFKLIETDTRMVVIPIEEEAKKLENELKGRIKLEMSFKNTLRKLGMYSIQVFDSERYDSMYKKMIREGVIEEIVDGISVLRRLDLYDKMIGLQYKEGDGFLSF